MNTKFPKEYKRVELGKPEEIFTPHYRFDSRGNLIMPFSPYQKIVFATKPGSRDISVGARSESDYPLFDPESIKTGYLHTSSVIKSGPKGGWVAQIAGGNADYPFAYYNEATGAYRFKVDKEGNVVLTGTIIAEAGQIGGWQVGATMISASSGAVGLSSEETAGDDIRIWAGSVTPNLASFIVYESGKVVCSNIIVTGIQSGSEIGIQEWQSTLDFSSSDYNTVAWTAGTITLMDGTAYSINVGNSGNLTTYSYIYLNPSISTTQLQITTDSALAIGAGKLLIGTARPNPDNTKDVIFQIYSGKGGVSQAIGSGQIVAGSVTAYEISVEKLSAISADIGEITAGTIDGVVITGGTVRTSAGTTRVQLDSGGFWANQALWYFEGSLNGRIFSTAGPLFNIMNPQNDSLVTIGTGDGLFAIFGGPAVLFYKNIVFTGSQTVDGVDVSVFAENFNTHIAFYNAHVGNASAHHSSTSAGLNITPAKIICSGLIQGSYFNMIGTVSYATRLDLSNFLTLPAISDPAAAAGKLWFNSSSGRFRGTDGSLRRDICYYDERNDASPIPAFESGIAQLKKIKPPVILEKGGLAFNTSAFPEEFRVKKAEQEHTDLLPVVGMLIQSQKELLEKVERLEQK